MRIVAALDLVLALPYLWLVVGKVLSHSQQAGSSAFDWFFLALTVAVPAVLLIAASCLLRRRLLQGLIWQRTVFSVLLLRAVALIACSLTIVNESGKGTFLLLTGLLELVFACLAGLAIVVVSKRTIR